MKSFRVALEKDGSLQQVTNESLRLLATAFIPLFTKFKGCVIGIAMKRSPGFVAAVMAMIELEIPFVYLHFDPLKYAWTMAKRFQVSAIISACKMEGSATYEEINVFDQVFYFYELNKLLLADLFNTKDHVFAYGTQTSGSTGEPKTVYVPWACIEANIQDLQNKFLYKNTEEEIILWATHLSFDPSLLELLLAIKTDSTLLILPDEWDNPGDDMLPECLNDEKLNIVFMQTTPTKLLMMSKKKLNWIFKKNSPIKNLLIGGEKFPVAFLNHIITPENTAKLFNIYGVTEVSCWGSITPAISFPRKNLDVSIGNNMLDTVIELDDKGRVFIRSPKRECVVNFQWNGKKHFTGDYGRESNGEIFIIGRATKSKGLKPSNEIQSSIFEKYANTFEIVNVIQSDYPSAMIIVVLSKPEQDLSFIEATIKKYIYESFPFRLHPSRIVAVFNNTLKTTQNGKIDVESILSQRLSSQNGLQLLQDLHIDISLPLNTPLYSLGLDSLRYLELALTIQPIFAKVFPSPVDCLNHIRDPQFTLEDLSRLLFIKFENNKFMQCDAICLNGISEELKQMEIKADACVETPVVETERYLVFGSFAGDVYTLNFDGTLIDKKYLGSPIEAAPIHNGYTFIASSHGRICKIDLNGFITFFLEIPGDIRCNIISNGTYLFVITSEKLLWRIHGDTGVAQDCFGEDKKKK